MWVVFSGALSPKNDQMAKWGRSAVVDSKMSSGNSNDTGSSTSVCAAVSNWIRVSTFVASSVAVTLMPRVTVTA